MLTLRPYQKTLKDAVYAYLRTRHDNPCAVVPTAGGKTPIMASICKDAVTKWNGRVLILAHVKELLEQTANKLRAVCPEVDFGIYSAGLKQRDTHQRVILAGIQSVYGRACELSTFNLVMVDEAHLIPLERDGMYRRFLSEATVVNPHVRIIGFTATPFRMKTGPICTPKGVLNHICHEVKIPELIRDRYLCPLISKSGTVQVDTSQLHVRDGDFVASEVESLMDQDETVRRACAEIVEKTVSRKAVLVFATGVQHGKHIVETLRRNHGTECGFVCGDTPSEERKITLNRFQSGELKFLCNVNVLTTGFDAPHIDCVALLRPTQSPGLYYQMVGRGFRVHPDKQDCLVLDFGGNVLRHGPVDDIRTNTPERGKGRGPVKECPTCQALTASGFGRCPHCQHAFPLRKSTIHEPSASEAKVLSSEVLTTTYDVLDIQYNVDTKEGATADDPKILRVDYKVEPQKYKSEWVYFEHHGYLRRQTVNWWRRRSPDRVPNTVERAIDIIYGGGLALTKQITVRSVTGEPFEQIIDHVLGPMPEPLPPGDEYPDDLHDVPF